MIKLILVLIISFFFAFFMWKAIDACCTVGLKLLLIAAIFAAMYGTARFVADNVSLQFLFLAVYAATAYSVCVNALSVRH